MSPISGRRRRTGQKLLHRQCWNWGRDIVRPEGNLLLDAGFRRRRPPEGETGSSCYTLALPNGGCLMLWGFGLLYGMPRKGGVRDDPWTDLDARHDPGWTDAPVAPPAG